MFRFFFSLALVLTALGGCQQDSSDQGQTQAIVIKNVTLIDGSGDAPKNNVNLVIQADTIASILPQESDALPPDAREFDMEGKTVIPMLMNAHGHLGMLKGTETSKEHYTRENIIRQLKKYESFGVGAVLSLGSDRDIIFGLRDSSQQGHIPGAMIYTAGYGFGAPEGAPPVNAGFDKVLRPATSDEAMHVMQQLASLKPDFVKMWVDDFGGSAPKMKPEIYAAVIREAHKHGLTVAAHVFYLEDAKKLVASGVDILAHSIRDQEIDDDLLGEMKTENVIYIPTLSLDEYNFIYLQQPEWMNDPFFKASLEPGMLDMLTSESYLEQLKNDPNLQKKIDNFQIALHNLQKIHNAGIKVAMGTDSGAQPVRAQGFSEHLELQLMVEAGLTPLQAITCATLNCAELLGIDENQGTLQVGKKADFIILDKNPVDDIRHTRSIAAVWRDGVEISKGPVNQE